MCFQVTGQGWNSPGAAWALSSLAVSSLPGLTPVISTACNQPGLLHSGARPETLKGCQLPPYPPLPIPPPRAPPRCLSMGEPISCQSECLKTSAQRTLQKGGGLLGREGGAEGRGGGSLILPRPVGSSLQHSGSTRPRGPGHSFCRVILSCPEGSWPKATFLVGSECGRERKHPSLPAPSTAAPRQAGFSGASAGLHLCSSSADCGSPRALTS